MSSFRFSEFEKRKSIWLVGTLVFLYSQAVAFSSSAPLNLLRCCFYWLYLASRNLGRQTGTCRTSGFMCEIHPCACVHLEHEGALNPPAHDYLMQRESNTYSMSVRCRWNAVCFLWGQWFPNQVYCSQDVQVLDQPKQFHLLMTVKNAASLHLLVCNIPNQTQLITTFWVQITSTVMIFYETFFIVKHIHRKDIINMHAQELQAPYMGGINAQNGKLNFVYQVFFALKEVLGNTWRKTH